MITGIDHTGLVVKDIEKELAFYRDVIGLEVDHDKEVRAPREGDHTGISNVHRRLRFLKDASGDLVLELIKYISPKSPAGQAPDHHQINSFHLCFKVENLEGIYEDLAGKGVRFLTPPKFINRPEGDRVCLAYAQDPEGNWIEFKEVLGAP